MHRRLKVKQHSFLPGAMSIIQMGEELIGHPSTAINELVKNGYDADALNCKVYFYYSRRSEKSFALIYDDGNGMEYETLFGDWLKPSVSSKRDTQAKSELYKRNFLGSKGIGRLAAMAVGEIVTVISKREDEKLFNWVTVCRKAFKEEKLLSEVYFPGDQIESYPLLFSDREYLNIRESKLNRYLLKILNETDLSSFKQGTLIIIENLDDSVLKILSEDHSQTEIPDELIEPYRNTHFYKSLATLITPLKLNQEIFFELLQRGIINKKIEIANEASSFSIHYGTNLFPDQDNNEIDWLEVVSIPIHSIYDYRAYGKVTRKGNVKGLLSYQRLENDIFEEKFDITVEEISDDKKTLFDFSESKEDYETGEYYFDIRVYDIGENENIEKLVKLSMFDSISKFRKAFKDFQGLRISKNGFGVKPYGEEVEDWIGLSKARVQNPGQNVNTNQILGYIFFYSPENDKLEEKTNREGFLENKSFMQVKNTLSNIFKTLGKRRYNYRLLHGIGRIPSSKHQRPDFETYLNQLKANNVSPSLISSSERFMKEVSTSMDNMEESLSFSERLAALGSGIELVYHELAQPLSGLRTTKSSLDLKKNRIEENALNSFISDINTIHHATEIIAELRQSLQPAIGRTRKKKFKILSTFLKVCNLYKTDTEQYNISVIVDERLKGYEIIDLEYAFWISFLNIINNAVYWIKKSEKPGEIRIQLQKDKIVVSNSGPFINEKLIDYIFDYGVTTRQEKNATGLGLAFTRSVLTKNNWEITAENRKNGPAFILKKIENE